LLVTVSGETHAQRENSKEIRIILISVNENEMTNREGFQGLTWGWVGSLGETIRTIEKGHKHILFSPLPSARPIEN
jgi:hypothetical protein